MDHGIDGTADHAQGLGVLGFEAQDRPRIPDGAVLGGGRPAARVGGRPRLIQKPADARRPFFHGALLRSQAFLLLGLSLRSCGAPRGQIVELGLG